MQTMFLQVAAISKMLEQEKFRIIKTDLKESVPEQSISLWRKRGFKPLSQGTAYVKFDGRNKLYVYPLFFDV